MKGKRKCENIDDKLHFPDNEFVTVNENAGFDTLHKLMNPTLKTLYADPNKGCDYRRGMMIQKKFLDKWLIGCLNLWTITLDVKSNDTIDSVKVEVESKTGILPHQQLLICGGKQLTEGRVLACYNIQKKSIVDLKIDIHHLNALRDKGKEELHNKEGLQMPKFEVSDLESLTGKYNTLYKPIVRVSPSSGTRYPFQLENGMKDEAKNVPHLCGQKLSRHAKVFDGVVHTWISIINFQRTIHSVIMSSATSAVTYTSVYTDSEPGRAFWGADDYNFSFVCLVCIVQGLNVASQLSSCLYKLRDG
ncbi:ubiquitin isoform X2 [Tanacetum coccineum]